MKRGSMKRYDIILKRYLENDKHYLLNPYYDEIQSKIKQDGWSTH